jgi:hypothetical protein
MRADFFIFLTTSVVRAAFYAQALPKVTRHPLRGK